VKTAESTKVAIKEKALAGVQAGKIYRELVDSAPSAAEEHKVFAPRDGNQVYNAIKNVKEKALITHDQFFNLHCIATHLDNFVRTIVSFPSQRFFVASEMTVDIFHEILFRDDLPTQQMAIDTTYCCGDFYVTVLTFRQTEFEDCSTIPLAYMYHQRKLQEDHDFFWREVLKIIPESDMCDGSFHKLCVPNFPKREPRKWYCENCKEQRRLKVNKK